MNQLHNHFIDSDTADFWYITQQAADLHVIVCRFPKFSFKSMKHFNYNDETPYFKPGTFGDLLNLQTDDYICSDEDKLKEILSENGVIMSKIDVLRSFISKGQIDYQLIKHCPNLLLHNLKQVETNLSKLKK